MKLKMASQLETESFPPTVLYRHEVPGNQEASFLAEAQAVAWDLR